MHKCWSGEFCGRKMLGMEGVPFLQLFDMVIHHSPFEHDFGLFPNLSSSLVMNGNDYPRGPLH
jgi:hypothetical protein